MRQRWHAIVSILLPATMACGLPNPGETGQPAITTIAVTTTGQTQPSTEPTVESIGGCPVTAFPEPGFTPSEPDDDVLYSEHFPTPDPWPGEYPGEGLVWYGSDGLWTVLSEKGTHPSQKSVWWSANFPGGMVEEEPELWVTWTLLDTDKPLVIDNAGEATNAYTPEEGWFMIAGIDPGQTGCWEVEATYKGASLSYVYTWPR